MAYYVTTPQIGAQKLSEVSTTAKHVLGEEVAARDTTVTGVKEATFISAKASAAILQYDCVMIKGATGFAARMADAHAKLAGQVAFAQIAFAADEYGWFMQNGLPLVEQEVYERAGGWSVPGPDDKTVSGKAMMGPTDMVGDFGNAEEINAGAQKNIQADRQAKSKPKPKSE